VQGDLFVLLVAEYTYLVLFYSIYRSIYRSVCPSLRLAACMVGSVYISVSLFVYLPVSLCLYVSIYLCTCISVSVSLCVSLSLCMSMPMSMSMSLSLSVSLCLCLCLSGWLSLSLYLVWFTNQSNCLLTAESRPQWAACMVVSTRNCPKSHDAKVFMSLIRAPWGNLSNGIPPFPVLEKASSGWEFIRLKTNKGNISDLSIRLMDFQFYHLKCPQKSLHISKAKSSRRRYHPLETYSRKTKGLQEKNMKELQPTTFTTSVLLSFSPFAENWRRVAIGQADTENLKSRYSQHQR